MMRLVKPSAVVLVLLGMIAASTIASANGPRRHSHGHGHGPRLGVGIVLSAPLWYPGPVFPSYPYGPYYHHPYPAPVAMPAPVYIERDSSAAVAQESVGQYWYYCRESDTYYPYVKQCSEPWQRVPARPPGQ